MRKVRCNLAQRPCPLPRCPGRLNSIFGARKDVGLGQMLGGFHVPLKVTFINGELSEWERLETAIGV